MKKSITLLSAVLAAGLLHAQVTIPEGSVKLPILPDSAAGHTFDVSNLSIPSEGDEQEWDYSDITSAQSDIYDYYLPHDTHPDFSNADAMKYVSPEFGQLTIDSTVRYYREDDQGIYYIGYLNQNKTYSLEPYTGNPNDEITIIPVSTQFNNEIPLIQLEMEYQNSWSTTRTINNQFSYTWDPHHHQTNSSLQKKLINNYDVVGEGTLTLGVNNFNDVPALLVKHTHIVIDSVFFSGNAATNSEIAPLGIEQGQSDTSAYYKFYVHDPDDPHKLRPALEFRMSSDFSTIEWGSYDGRPYQTDIDNSVKEHELYTNVKLYPNPVAGEGSIILELEKDATENMNISIYSIGGAMIDQQRIAANESNITFNTDSYATGMYIVEGKNKNGETRILEKFIKK